MVFKQASKILFLVVFVVIFFKILFFLLVKLDFLNFIFSGSSDADYYDNFALGYVNDAVNIWPVILNKLNFFGLYNRDYISFILLLLNLIIIPLLACKLANLQFKNEQKYFLSLFFICLLYPTLYFYTFDIYRDVFMVFCFLLACSFVKFSIYTNNFILKYFYFLISFLFGFFLFELREYLGYAFWGALFLYHIKLTKKRTVLFFISYMLILFIFNYLGFFKSLTDYRTGFEEYSGGSTLGLDFSNPIMFIPNFILSILGQLFGLYITNPSAILLFFVETLPFIFMLFYILNNIGFADRFVRFLLIFFILYASVWLIGNDNLGTAVRLRMYNYFAIYICFFYIIKIKEAINFGQVIKK
ncbi:hypothetical protein [Acinetobacter oleivorans]|uniref:hypothetical protein n=1 Tax=Acinetobacter oleivorans TaxID=1148157 RepID=UPI003A84638E